MRLVTRKKVLTISILLSLLLILVILFSIMVGSVKVKPLRSIMIFLRSILDLKGTETETERAIILSLRVPRALLAGLVGAGLSVSGAVFQALLRNPLADPYILGVSSGSAVGAIIAILMGIGSLSFGIPHLLAKDPKDPEAFFRSLLANPRVADRDWVAWNHAFSLLQMKSKEDARRELSELSERVTEPVLLLLVLYLLDVLAKDDAALEQRVAGLRERLSKGQTPASFQKTIEKAAGNMQVVVLSKLLQDAVQWLFAGVPGAPQPATP